MNKENIITLFHGTTVEAASEILNKQKFDKSNNEDDWLGKGIYFYENLNNAILYNIRKYYNTNKNYPTYDNLQYARKVLVIDVECSNEDIVDFNEIENLQKLLGLWKMFHDRVKHNNEYKTLKYKDGYMINWLLENTDFFAGCKIFKNTFNLDLRFRRKINKIFNKKTRIGYDLNQIFWCIINDDCINNIYEYDEGFEDKYELIKDYTNNILL